MWGLFILLIHISAAQTPTLPPEFLKHDISTVAENLQKATLTLDQLAQQLNQEEYDLLCLGETHNEFFRNFYGEFLKKLRFDTLFLEATPKEMEKIQQQWNKEKKADLLGVTIGPILQAISPESPILGVESTQEQNAAVTLEKIKTEKETLSRDGFIAWNITQAMSPHKKHVTVFGKTHCSFNNDGAGAVPFFNMLVRAKPHQKWLNAMILEKPQGKIHPLISLLNYGSESPIKETIVVDSSKLTPQDYNYHWEIRSLFENFRFIIIP